MIEHVVALKVKEGKVFDVLKALDRLSDIPQIDRYTAGETFTTDRNQGYQILLNVRVKDNEALNGYLKHPTHLEILANDIKPVVENIMVLDIDV